MSDTTETLDLMKEALRPPKLMPRFAPDPGPREIIRQLEARHGENWTLKDAEKLIAKYGRDDLHFENNSALRSYLLNLAMRLLEKADAIPSPASSDPQFSEKWGIKMGLTEAANFLREESANLRMMSQEEYGS